MIDRTSGTPAFRQVAAAIRSKISSGEYAPGSQLPSERELIGVYGVSRPTIRDAVGLLRSEGVVVAEHGKGVFVRSPGNIKRLSQSRLSRAARKRDEGAFLADAQSGGWQASSSIKVRFEPADQRATELLGISEGAEVTVRDRVMRADGLVVQLAISRVPRGLTEGTAIERVETGPGGMYARLEESGHTIDHFDETVGARMPTPEEASTMQLPAGVPVITVTRVAYSRGRALELNDMRLAADRYELGYRIPAD